MVEYDEYGESDFGLAALIRACYVDPGLQDAELADQGGVALIDPESAIKGASAVLEWMRTMDLSSACSCSERNQAVEAPTGPAPITT